MKNNGFTLIELMCVIVLLGILSVVIVPKIGDSISNSKKQAYNAQVESIKRGANDFAVKSSNFFSDDSSITVKLGMLKQGGYLPVNIKDPITRKDFSNESTITISFDGLKYDFDLNLFDVTSLEDVNENSPIIVLNGNYIEYVEVGSLYTEMGASAMSSNGDILTVGVPQIKLNGSNVLSIDTSSLNTYSVTYEASDNFGNSSSAVRTVVVRDSSAPIISIPSSNKLHISEIADYDLMDGIVVSDNFDDNPVVTVDSSLSNLPGKYVISYTATDFSGNSSTERRVINVDYELQNTFTRLEYIESTGTQYINSLYYPTPNTGIYADFCFTTVALQNGLYGIETDQSNLTDFLTYAFYINGSSKFAYAYSNTKGNWISSNISADTNRHILEFNINDNKISIDSGDFYSATISGNPTNTAIAPLFIFACNYVVGASLSPNSFGKVKLYDFKIYEGGELVRDFYPCLRNSDGVLGLCENVNNSFYKNAGSGEFLYGDLDG